MKGLTSVFSRELWFTREVLNDVIIYLLNTNCVPSKKQLISPKKVLTKQEMIITNMVCQGSRNNEVAASLNISAHTVNTHIHNVYRKTDSHNRVQPRVDLRLSNRRQNPS
ncbi:MAG: helix-turn-helix transcriptional regulator [Gammaproteobacteria bacterium]|nr:helix-turn-helix transcriptional regulator [Gammaproteobacteria bacterium]